MKYSFKVRIQIEQMYDIDADTMDEAKEKLEEYISNEIFTSDFAMSVAEAAEIINPTLN